MVARLPAIRQIGLADERAREAHSGNAAFAQISLHYLEAAPAARHDDGDVELAVASFLSEGEPEAAPAPAPPKRRAAK